MRWKFSLGLISLIFALVFLVGLSSSQVSYFGCEPFLNYSYEQKDLRVEFSGECASELESGLSGRLINFNGCYAILTPSCQILPAYSIGGGYNYAYQWTGELKGTCDSSVRGNKVSLISAVGSVIVTGESGEGSWIWHDENFDGCNPNLDVNAYECKWSNGLWPDREGTASVSVAGDTSCIDKDRDCVSSCSKVPDCDDTSVIKHPGFDEYCDDDKDNDCAGTCVGGDNDKKSCDSGSECPGGSCVETDDKYCSYTSCPLLTTESCSEYDSKALCEDRYERTIEKDNGNISTDGHQCYWEYYDKTCKKGPACFKKIIVEPCGKFEVDRCSKVTQDYLDKYGYGCGDFSVIDDQGFEWLCIQIQAQDSCGVRDPPCCNVFTGVCGTYQQGCCGLPPSGGGFSFDSDGDGLDDDEEVDIGTNPGNPDTDDDGIIDGDDISPFDPNIPVPRITIAYWSDMIGVIEITEADIGNTVKMIAKNIDLPDGTQVYLSIYDDDSFWFLTGGLFEDDYIIGMSAEIMNRQTQVIWNISQEAFDTAVADDYLTPNVAEFYFRVYSDFRVLVDGNLFLANSDILNVEKSIEPPEPPPTIELTYANWTNPDGSKRIEAEVGDIVNLTARGTEIADGTEIMFEVFDENIAWFASEIRTDSNALYGIMNGGEAVTSMNITQEDFDLGEGDRKFYFIASLVSDASINIQSELLNITEVPVEAPLCVQEIDDAWWLEDEEEVPSLLNCYREDGVDETGNPKTECCPLGEDYSCYIDSDSDGRLECLPMVIEGCMQFDDDEEGCVNAGLDVPIGENCGLQAESNGDCEVFNCACLWLDGLCIDDDTGSYYCKGGIDGECYNDNVYSVTEIQEFCNSPNIVIKDCNLTRGEISKCDEMDMKEITYTYDWIGAEPRNLTACPLEKTRSLPCISSAILSFFDTISLIIAILIIIIFYLIIVRKKKKYAGKKIARKRKVKSRK